MRITLTTSGKPRRSGVLRLPAKLETMTIAKDGVELTLSRAEVAALLLDKRLAPHIGWQGGPYLIDPNDE